jgi:hypothetical protein
VAVAVALLENKFRHNHDREVVAQVDLTLQVLQRVETVETVA